MYAHIPFDRYKSWRAICLRWLIFFTLKQQAYYTDSVYLDYIEDDQGLLSLYLPGAGCAQ